jgi:hypothetical protein
VIKYYDRKGNVVGLEEFSALFENIDYKYVAKTDAGKYWISTVWLGLDHSFSLDDSAPPIIFESMVFRKDKDGGMDFSEEQECHRYATEEEAVAGHEKLVRKWRGRH